MRIILYIVVLLISGLCGLYAQSGGQAPTAISDVPVIGRLQASELNERLSALGEINAKQSADNAAFISNNLGASSSTLKLQLFGHKPAPVWAYTQHQFGYLPTSDKIAGRDAVDIAAAGTIQADSTLKSSQVKITLDRLRVADYPGNGRHKILFTFTAQNQLIGGTPETTTFSQSYEVEQGQGSGIAGYPIYLGLNVPDNGISLSCHTTNVSNDNDEKVLGFLNESTFTNGIELLNTASPAVPVVTQFATGLVKEFESRRENVGVQDFFMGLDFSGSLTGVRLAQGSYIAVQAPDDSWKWSDWVFNVAKGQIVSRKDGTGIPYNYVVFSLTKM